MKRRLQFVTAVASGLALIGGALMYSFGMVPSLRKYFNWKTEIKVVAFDSARGFTIFNNGDGAVLLSHVDVDIAGIDTRTVQIEKVIKPSELFQHVEPFKDANKPYHLLAHVSPAEWQTAIAYARTFDTSGCIRAVAFTDNDPSYMLYADASRRDPHHFPVLKASISLHYYDLRKGAGRVQIPAHAFLFRRSDCNFVPLAPK